MFTKGFIVLFMITECLCIRLPGLNDDNPFEDQSPFIPFAASGDHENNYNQPAFKDSVSESLYDVFTGRPDWDTVTTKQPPTHSPTGQQQVEETSMEMLLDKIFGGESWRSLLHQSNSDTTTHQESLHDHDDSAVGNSHGSGFFSNQMSADNIFNGIEHGNGRTTTKPKMSHDKQNTASESNGSSDTRKKTLMKYTGSFINTNLHSYKPGETTTDSRPLSSTIHDPVTLPPPQVFNVPLNGEPMPFGQQLTGGNGFNADAFNPNVVNSILSSYNPNGNSAIFATQTGSNPQNMNMKVDYNADKVNRNYMKESSEHQENNLPPGVISSTGTADQGHRELYNNQPKFDANKINENLLEENWMFSEKPANVMAPAFLTGNVDRRVSIVNHAAKSDTTNQRQTPLQSSKSRDDTEAVNNDDQANGVVTNTANLQENAQFSFVPGNLYPVRQGQSRNNAPSISMPVFDANSVNAQQTRFNPNSISWIQRRNLHKRGVDERKLNLNRSDSLKDSFGKSNSSLEGNTVIDTRNGNSNEPSNSNAKNDFGKAQHVTQRPLLSNAGSSVYSGFNPNKLNTEQGQGNFVPGQMSPYDSNSNQYLGGKSDVSSFYKPNSTSAKLLNFDIGSLLGMEKGLSSNGLGFAGAFNPTSLNKMMMTSLTDNLQSNASFDPNASGFKDAGGNSNFGNGFGLSSNSSMFSQGPMNNSGYMKGGFDANAANVGFGDVLRGGASAGFGFGSSTGTNVSSSASGFGGFGAAGGFDPNAANVGFGATDYGMGGLSGPVGAFGGSFNADTMNAGLLGQSNSTDVKDLMSYFLGAKMKVEGGSSNDGSSSLYDSGYMGSFNPDSVNQVSYDPNKYNNIKIHFNPSDMLARNPGMDKDTLANAVLLFDPDKINSLYKQQSFNPEALLQYIPGVSNTKIQEQTGSQNEGSESDQSIFDPFETMKKLMQVSSSFQPGNMGLTTPNTTSAVTNTTVSAVAGPSTNASTFGNAPTQAPQLSTTEILLTTLQTNSTTSTPGLVYTSEQSTLPPVTTSDFVVRNNTITNK